MGLPAVPLAAARGREAVLAVRGEEVDEAGDGGVDERRLEAELEVDEHVRQKRRVAS